MKEKASQFNLKMSQQLKLMRSDAKLTMRQLARNIDVPHSFIGKTEREGRRLDVGEFVIYCQGMGYDPVTTLRSLINNQ